MSTRQRQSNYVPFTVRLDNELRNEMDTIAEYERSGTPSELVRTWIRLQVNSYRGNKLYLAWKERKAAEAKVG